MADGKADRRSFLQRNLLILLLFTTIASIPLQWRLGRTTELSPNHSDAVMTSAFAIGIVTGFAFALLVAIVKPASRSSTTATAIGFFFCGAILGTLSGMAFVDAAFQAIDFSGPNVTRKVEDIAIARAYKTHGKGACDHIFSFATILEISASTAVSIKPYLGIQRTLSREVIAYVWTPNVTAVPFASCIPPLGRSVRVWWRVAPTYRASLPMI